MIYLEDLCVNLFSKLFVKVTKNILILASNVECKLFYVCVNYIVIFYVIYVIKFMLLYNSFNCYNLRMYGLYINLCTQDKLISYILESK